MPRHETSPSSAEPFSQRKRAADRPAKPVSRRERTLQALGPVRVNPEPLLAVLHATPTDPHDVARAIGRCNTLSSRVLSVTNSAAYSITRPIEDLQRATIYLGASRARAIAMAFGLRCLHQQTPLPDDWAQQLWIASLRKAAAARLACNHLDADWAQSAYCGGLIQDLGLGMLVSVDPGFYGQLIPGTAGTWAQQERDRFGLDHAEVGALLLERWNASEYAVELVRGHHHWTEQLDGGPFAEQGLRRIPLMLASLMPHHHEELTGSQHDWLVALHAQFLSDHYPSPGGYLEAARQDAAQLHGDAGQSPDIATLTNGLIDAVADDAVGMVAQLCRLESTLMAQQEDLEQLRFQAMTDALTQVLNRRGFAHLAERRLAKAHQRGQGVCCMMIDIDNFKPINDQHGHETGDRLLIELARGIEGEMERMDLLGRQGGDEFVVLLVDVAHRQAQEAARRIVQACADVQVRARGGVTLSPRVSLGAAYADSEQDLVTLEKLLEVADAAMYRQKHSGKNGCSFETIDQAA